MDGICVFWGGGEGGMVMCIRGQVCRFSESAEVKADMTSVDATLYIFYFIP